MSTSDTLWSPKPWLAAAFNFFLCPLGFIYAKIIPIGIIYLVVQICIAIASKYIYPSSTILQAAALLLNIAAAMHVYFHAKKFTPIFIQSKINQSLKNFGVYVLLFIIPFIALKALPIEYMQMPSASMEPTIDAGAMIRINKSGIWNYKLLGQVTILENNSPTVKRGNLAVFYYPSNASVSYVKRVIGLPGDSITYANKQLTINGKKITSEGDLSYVTALKENMGDTAYSVRVTPGTEPLIPIGVQEFPYKNQCNYNPSGFTCKVPRGMYFMMGDNRDNSNDSRYWGFVPANHIYGIVDKIGDGNS